MPFSHGRLCDCPDGAGLFGIKIFMNKKKIKEICLIRKYM